MLSRVNGRSAQQAARAAEQAAKRAKDNSNSQDAAKPPRTRRVKVYSVEVSPAAATEDQVARVSPSAFCVEKDATASRRKLPVGQRKASCDAIQVASFRDASAAERYAGELMEKHGLDAAVRKKTATVAT